VQRLAKSPAAWAVTIERVSHITDSISSNWNAKSFGDAAPCQFDMACVVDVVSPPQKPSFQSAANAVAMLIATDSVGNSLSCTGTLLNSANYPLPLFLTAYHCVEYATSILTVWSYARTACNSGSPGPYVQVPGGGKPLYRDASLDTALILLYGQVPPLAVFAGWDATLIQQATTALAVHHPKGDVQKGSIGNIVGQTQPRCRSTTEFSLRELSIWLIG